MSKTAKKKKSKVIIHTHRNIVFPLLCERLKALGKQFAEENDLTFLSQSYSSHRANEGTLWYGYISSTTHTRTEGWLRKKEIEYTRPLKEWVVLLGFYITDFRETGLFKILIYADVVGPFRSIHTKLRTTLNDAYDELVAGIKGWDIEIRLVQPRGDEFD